MTCSGVLLSLPGLLRPLGQVLAGHDSGYREVCSARSEGAVFVHHPSIFTVHCHSTSGPTVITGVLPATCRGGRHPLPRTHSGDRRRLTRLPFFPRRDGPENGLEKLWDQGGEGGINSGNVSLTGLRRVFGGGEAQVGFFGVLPCTSRAHLLASPPGDPPVSVGGASTAVSVKLNSSGGDQTNLRCRGDFMTRRRSRSVIVNFLLDFSLDRSEPLNALLLVLDEPFFIGWAGRPSPPLTGRVGSERGRAVRSHHSRQPHR
ncbi:hypothetical protein J6590_092589 [Homalodisca vitripennis]|nr:hypothetical protein J6590_092589 [Homalodisca vitripennis]